MLRRHFIEKDSIGNKLGGRRTHFWGDVRKNTQLGAITDREATIAIGESRFAQRLYGGTITAKTPWKGSGFKLLTEKAVAEAAQEELTLQVGNIKSQS